MILDLFVFYSVVCYLIVIGVIVRHYEKPSKNKITFLFTVGVFLASPLLIPIFIGVVLEEIKIEH